MRPSPVAVNGSEFGQKTVCTRAFRLPSHTQWQLLRGLMPARTIWSAASQA